MQPEAIAAGALTHINLAFVLFDDTFNIVDAQGDIVARVSRLKMTYPDLRVNAAIGGWSFNDPPTQDFFSNMVSTYDNRQTFINSVMSYLQRYDLDGIDIGRYNSNVVVHTYITSPHN
jgi:GH18 family chitinase